MVSLTSSGSSKTNFCVAIHVYSKSGLVPAAAGLPVERRLVQQCPMLLHQVWVQREPWVVARVKMVDGAEQK